MRIFLALLLSAWSASAATWYVDNTASGSNNGTSWANAWTSIDSAEGASVVAGDTVYISGGTSGGAGKTYTGFQPKSGSGGSFITYRVGQETGHNGVVTFTDTGAWVSNPQYLIIDGSNNLGHTNFVLTGITSIVNSGAGSAVNVRISYVNFGSFRNSGNTGRIVDVNQGAGYLEIDHCYILINDSASSDDIVIRWENGDTSAAYDSGLRFHHNYLYVPQTDGGTGMDGLRLNGDGWSVYNNYIIGIDDPGYQSGEHADGIQDWQGNSNYIKVYNNVFVDWRNASCNISVYNREDKHVRVYQNIQLFTNNDSTEQNQGIFVGVGGSGSPGGPHEMEDIVIGYNLVVSGGRLAMNNTTATTATWTDCWVAGNVAISTSGPNTSGTSGIKSHNNVTVTTGNAATYYTTWVSDLSGTNNNFRPTASATTLLNAGTNLTALGITTDFDGNARPSSGNWTIGPFQYQAGDASAPTLSSATIGTSGGTITLAFNESVTVGAGGSAGFTTSLSGGAATLTYSSGSGTSSLVYTISRTVYQGETGTISYTQPTNGIEDAAGNDLATFSGTSATNNSTQQSTVVADLSLSGSVSISGRVTFQ